MDLNSYKDKILISNCISVKNQEILYDRHIISKEKINFFNYYKQLSSFLANGDIASFKENLKPKDYDLLQESPQQLAKKYIDITKQFYIKSGKYSDEKFQEFKNAFYKGNEDLLENEKTKNFDELEEEPTFCSHLTPAMTQNLTVLEKFFKMYNPETMSAHQLKKFAKQYEDLSKRLGINKFQQYFDEQGQTITDMKITEINTAGIRPTYASTFTLLDANSQQSTQTIQEYAPTSDFTSTYYQNLCHSYLEARKCTRMSENSIDSTTISKKMSFFKDSYENLKEMMSKCKITISNGSIFYSSESEIIPELVLPETSEKSTNDKSDNEPSL